MHNVRHHDPLFLHHKCDKAASGLFIGDGPFAFPIVVAREPTSARWEEQNGNTLIGIHPDQVTYNL